MTTATRLPVAVSSPSTWYGTASPFAFAVGLATVWNWTAGLPGGLAVTGTLSVLLLLAGLPHGSFDIMLLRDGRGVAGPGVVFAIYVALGAAALGLWLTAPVIALAVFLLVSVVHFAEDWTACGVPALAAGLALSLFAAPAVAHPDETRRLFAALADSPDASRVADLLKLVAPTAFALGLVGVVELWRTGHRRRSIDAAAAVGGMLLLPPLVGFALFFCLFHSPLHFNDALDRLSWRGTRHWIPVALPVTFAALGLAAALFALAPVLELPLRVFGTSFLTLAVLTIPHMVVPPIIAALRGRMTERPGAGPR